MSKVVSVILLLFLILKITTGQQIKGDYPGEYFQSPVDFRILLSGTFGELRSDHFHSGIDIKTAGVEGKKIFAVADGYVSRIKVSPYGFGRALYITHPNGFTSVYAHLQKFNSNIQQYTIQKQYDKRSFAVDIPVEKNKIMVKKGDVIAYSGNTGGSGGPHLHFELRSSNSQYPINPLLFGIEVKDWIRPKILAIKIYPVNANSTINDKCDTVVIATEGWGPDYRLPKNDTLNLTGEFAFGIQTYDLLNDVNNKNGPYSIEFYIDSLLSFSIYAETFSFGETRYLNSMIDYEEFKKTKRRFVKTYIAPNNKLSIYRKVINDGTYIFDDDQLHQLMYKVTDVMGNVSTLAFYVQGNNLAGDTLAFPTPDVPTSSNFLYDRSNQFTNDDLKLDMPVGSLYDNFEFKYKQSAPTKGSYSKLHHVHNKYTPVHKYYNLSIKVDSIPDNLTDKLYISRYDNGKSKSVGGEYNHGWVETRAREFGDFHVVADTINPYIKALNIYNGKNIGTQYSIRMKISDDESGIESYTGTLNDEWILMDYDAKYDLLVYHFDDRLKKGNNIFKLKVKDKKGNTNLFEAKLVY